MTGSDPSAVQALAASRVYRIQAAVRSLNADIRAAQEEDSTEEAWAPNFQFIARSWRYRDSPRFNFTYFEVFEFDDKKAQEIVGDIKDNTDAWSRLLNTLAGSLSEPSVQEARTFVEQILESQPCPEDVNRADLHHHLLQLMATMDVGGAIPAAVQCRLDTRTSDRHVAYRVELRVNNERELPDLRIVPIDQDENPSHGQSDDEWAEQLLSFGGEETGNSADGTDDNPSAAFMKQSRYWFRHSDTSRRADSCFLWIPVYEDSRFGHFAGRFLGWLFCPNPDGQLTWEDVSRCLRACNAFARDLVHIYTQAFLTLPADEEAYRNDPRKHVQRHLPAWEGWKKVDLLDTWSGEKDEWWRYCEKTRHLQIRLGATAYDDPGAWGEFKDLNPIALTPGSNMAPSTDWTRNGQSQAEHIRTLTRRLCRRITTLKAARHKQALTATGDWSHEVKNYSEKVYDDLDVYRNEWLNKCTGQPFDPRLQSAYDGILILNKMALTTANLHAGWPLPSPAEGNVVRVLDYLLKHQRRALKSYPVSLCYKITGCACGAIDTKNLTAEDRCAFALLRELVSNIKNPWKTNRLSESEAGICVDCTVVRDNGVVTATVKQTQVVGTRQDVSRKMPPGLGRAHSLFCNTFGLGDIRWKVCEQRKERRRHITRECTVIWTP